MRHGRLRRIDLRGRDTPRSREPVGAAGRPARALEAPTPHVVAHDIGGAVALDARLDSGRAFASLLLLDIVLLDPWGSDFFRLVADHDDVFGAIPEPLHAALVRAYIEGAPRRPLDAEVIDALVQPWRGANGRRAFVRQIGALADDGARTRELVGRLGEVDEPALVAWGTDDPWIPVEQADRLAATLPRSRAPVLFDGCGHLVPLESPTAFGRLLRSWLDANTVPEGRAGTIAQA